MISKLHIFLSFEFGYNNENICLEPKIYKIKNKNTTKQFDRGFSGA